MRELTPVLREAPVKDQALQLKTIEVGPMTRQPESWTEAATIVEWFPLFSTSNHSPRLPSGSHCSFFWLPLPSIYLSF